jgi:hypothetical protein
MSTPSEAPNRETDGPEGAARFENSEVWRTCAYDSLAATVAGGQDLWKNPACSGADGADVLAA